MEKEYLVEITKKELIWIEAEDETHAREIVEDRCDENEETIIDIDILDEREIYEEDVDY